MGDSDVVDDASDGSGNHELPKDEAAIRDAELVGRRRGKEVRVWILKRRMRLFLAVRDKTDRAPSPPRNFLRSSLSSSRSLLRLL